MLICGISSEVYHLSPRYAPRCLGRSQTRELNASCFVSFVMSGERLRDIVT